MKIYFKKLLSFKATGVPQGTPRILRGTGLSVPPGGKMRQQAPALLPVLAQPRVTGPMAKGESHHLPTSFPTHRYLPHSVPGFNSPSEKLFSTDCGLPENSEGWGFLQCFHILVGISVCINSTVSAQWANAPVTGLWSI